jgi:diguanylate cyclase (GGDEF)-like protein
VRDVLKTRKGTPGWISAQPTLDAIALLAIGLGVWWFFDASGTSARFFDNIPAEIHVLLESLFLTGVVLAGGTAIFAVRRWSEVRCTEASAIHMALHDELTGLPNRRAFLASLRRSCSDAATEEFACIMFDLDNFKLANDTHGHLVGDELLRAIPRRLKAFLPGNSEVARLSGDEFAVIIPLEGRNIDVFIANKIVRSLNEPFPILGKSINIGASVGIARYPHDARDADSLLRKSALALYQSKFGGRGRVTKFNQFLDEANNRRSELEQELRAGLKRGDIVPHYQPLVDVRNGSLDGFEVLARWTTEKFGVIEPQEFIPIATELGLISELSENMMKRACREAASWVEPKRISFNIAPQQLADANFSTTFLAIVKETGIVASRIDIEVTEEAFLANTEVVSDVVFVLKAHGVTFSLDDFGIGYSSLKHLQMIPFDTIKIDRSFLREAQGCAKARSLLEAIVVLGHSVGTRVLAEGVEEEIHAELVSKIGCDQAQGWLFGKATAKPIFSPIAQGMKPLAVA